MGVDSINSIIGNLTPFLALTRFGNSLFGTFTVLLSGLLSSELIGNEFNYLLAGIVSIFLFMGSFSINDYFDHNIDTANERKDRPVANGTISRDKALNIGIGTLFLAFFISLFLGELPSIFIGFNILLTIIYSSHLKKILLLKNITIAYCFTATILFGTIVADNFIEPLIGFYMLMAFLVGMAFEILSDMVDIKGDMEHNVRTIAVFHSPRSAAIISSLFFMTIIILDPLPYFINIHPNLHQDKIFFALILPIILAYMFIIKSLICDRSPKNVFNLRSKTLLVMQLGSLVYLIGFLL